MIKSTLDQHLWSRSMCDVDEDDFPDEYVNDVDRTIIQRKRPK